MHSLEPSRGYNRFTDGMGNLMFMSLGSTAASDEDDAATPIRRRAHRSRAWYQRTGLLLGLWVVLSALWVGGVGYNIYQTALVQADMSRDVERDLDEGFVPASCVGAACGTANSESSRLGQQTENWIGIAMTFIRFGSDEVAELVVGPPLGLLIVGIGVVVMRRKAARKREAALSA
jgi:hypothetical protein